VKYHLADDARRPAQRSTTNTAEMDFPDRDTIPTAPPNKKIMVFYNFTCMTSTMESVSQTHNSL
jgi:hypothetical protein